MRIWLVTVGETLPVAGSGNPRLLRTGVLAGRLVELGHQVLWWTSAFDHFQKRHHCESDTTVNWEGGAIRMLKSVGYQRNVSLRRFVEHAGVARKFREQAPREPRPDIILASLPTIELAREAVRFGHTRQVPVLLDVRDLWPDAQIDVLPWGLKWLSRVMFRPMIRDTSYALANCTGIVGISAGYLEWGLSYANRARSVDDGMFPLGYGAPASSSCNLDEARDRLFAMGVDPSKKIYWYVGSFGRQYDLGPVLQAASLLHREGRTDIQFIISGEGELGRRWRQLAAGAGNVIFTGWVGADDINWLRAHAEVGLQPYIDGAPQGLANKLFEYLSAGVPVISSLQGENERLIERYRCGLTYKPGDALSCLEKIRVLADNDEMRRSMGHNKRGRKLFASQFDGSVVFDGLAAHLEAVANRHGSQRKAF